MAGAKIQDLRKKVERLETHLAQVTVELETFESELTNRINLIPSSSASEGPTELNKLRSLLNELQSKASGYAYAAGTLMAAYREYSEELERLIPRT